MTSLLSHVFALLVASSTCSDAVDPYTSLTQCELKDLRRQIKIRRSENPPPVDIANLDSLIVGAKRKKYQLLLDYHYQLVCNVCFANKLSCGNRVPNDTFFVCISEHGVSK